MVNNTLFKYESKNMFEKSESEVQRCKLHANFYPFSSTKKKKFQTFHPPFLSTLVKHFSVDYFFLRTLTSQNFQQEADGFYANQSTCFSCMLISVGTRFLWNEL